MPRLKVLIAGGGTGGHLFPGMAIAEALEAQGPTEVQFVGTARGIEVKAIPEKGWPLHLLPVSGLYRVGPLRKALGLVKLPLALSKAAGLLIRYRPHLVIGVGGYASGPLLLMALALGFKTVIQEQNAYPGMTNRILGKRVPLAFVPFAGLEGVFKNPVVVGNPIRRAIIDAAEAPQAKAATPLVLALVGGSQGARALNQALTGALPFLLPWAERLFIVHQTGKLDYEEVAAAYAKYPQFKAQVAPFLEDMVSLYRRAHLFVCRSGSMVNELCAMGCPSILIPIPNSSGDHQLKNALALSEAGAARLLDQADLTPESLAQAVAQLLEAPDQLEQMSQAAKALYPGDAAAKIAAEIRHFYHFDQPPFTEPL
ncbi:MAG: undecaprenyldiphospho-muramoylpentapeptide beta-N-acetylglucosaminyltransferase [bacterium]|nr:undecaprenyldiphospho-muramoylpentapeptide beta-N-acetylglucosaminyltransferase [bacterium]